jgi:hypothetical protein
MQRIENFMAPAPEEIIGDVSKNSLEEDRCIEFPQLPSMIRMRCSALSTGRLFRAAASERSCHAMSTMLWSRVS